MISVNAFVQSLLFCSLLTRSCAMAQSATVHAALTTPSKTQEEIISWLPVYSEVINLVEQKSFQSVAFSDFIVNSLKAAISQVDAHSAFFDEKSYRSLREAASGEFSGIGVSILSKAPDDDTIAIIDVIPNGPADGVGMLPGDAIIAIEGEPLKGLSTDEVITKIKGKQGTSVTVKIIRARKEAKEFSIVRNTIKDQTALCYSFNNHNIYYVALKTFNEASAKQISQLLSKTTKSGCRGIILDLRRNPGGTLDSAIEMAELFLEKDSLVVSTKYKDGTVVRSYKTTKTPLVKSDTPLFVLVDNFTASASEILAGCLRHHAAEHTPGNEKLSVFIVGTTTFGKGSVQEVIPIGQGCALKLTTMLYYLPDDSSIQAVGIVPDFCIKPKFFPSEEARLMQELYGTESNLKHHVPAQKKSIPETPSATQEPSSQQEAPAEKGFWDRLFNKQKKAPVSEETDKCAHQPKQEKSWEQRQQEYLSADVQVQASINMINLLHLAKKLNPHAVASRDKALAFLKEHFVTDDTMVPEKVR